MENNGYVIAADRIATSIHDIAKESDMSALELIHACFGMCVAVINSEFPESSRRQIGELVCDSIRSRISADTNQRFGIH